jgi:hypothetical protein
MFRRFAAPAMLALGALTLLAAVPAQAAPMQPGLWSFTQQTSGGGAKRSTRCVRPAEAADPLRYFAPRGGGRAARCEIVENSSFGDRVSSRLRCNAGAGATDLISMITIDTPQHMTIATTLSTTAGGKTSSISMRGEGRRIGNCR